MFKLRYLASWCSTLSESSWDWTVSRGRSLAQTNYIPILTRFASTFQFHRERRTTPHWGYCDRCVLGLIQSNWKVTWRLFTFTGTRNLVCQNSSYMIFAVRSLEIESSRLFSRNGRFYEDLREKNQVNRSTRTFLIKSHNNRFLCLVYSTYI